MQPGPASPTRVSEVLRYPCSLSELEAVLNLVDEEQVAAHLRRLEQQLGVVRGVLSKKENERRSQKARDKIEERERLRKLFAAMTTHDLTRYVIERKPMSHYARRTLSRRPEPERAAALTALKAKSADLLPACAPGAGVDSWRVKGE